VCNRDKYLLILVDVNKLLDQEEISDISGF
jgi:purine-binding chemotaxis protein CheW